MSQELTPKPPASNLFAGASYLLRALNLLIATPRLRQYVVLPILLNLVVGVTLYASLLYAGFQAIDTLLTAIPGWVASAPPLQPDLVGDGSSTALPWLPTIHLPNWFLPNGLPKLPPITLPDWLPHLSLPNLNLPSFNLPKLTLPSWVVELPEVGLTIFIWLLRLLLVLTLLLLTGFVLLQFGVLLGAPWYGQLSEEIEKQQTGQLETISINPAQEIWRAVLYELKKLMLTIGIGLPLLICNFLPGFGTAVATIGGISLAATIVCLDFLDSALERRRLPFRQKLSMIRQSLPASAGFALVCLGLVSIPLLNLLAIPVCIAAGTLFACEQVLPLLPSAKS